MSEIIRTKYILCLKQRFRVLIRPNEREADITIRTRYMIMLLEYDRWIPFSHTCMAAISQWTFENHVGQHLLGARGRLVHHGAHTKSHNLYVLGL